MPPVTRSHTRRKATEEQMRALVYECMQLHMDTTTWWTRMLLLLLLLLAAAAALVFIRQPS